VIGRLVRHALLRRAYLHYTRDFDPQGDHVKAKGFAVPIRYRAHGDAAAPEPDDAEWAEALERSEKEIVSAVGDLMVPPHASPTVRTRALDRLIPLLGYYERSLWLSGSLRFIRRRLAAALRGDTEARRWFLSRARARLSV
jgi:hypothetical protein